MSTYADMNNREIQRSMHCSTVLRSTLSAGFTIHGYLSSIPLWTSIVWGFESFYSFSRAYFLSAFCSSKTTANELSNGSCILPGSVSPGSDVLPHSVPWNEALVPQTLLLLSWKNTAKLKLVSKQTSIQWRDKIPSLPSALFWCSNRQKYDV